jgi:V/A-type H+-transporting ATPase subunit K
VTETFWGLSGVDWVLLGGAVAVVLGGTGSAIGITAASATASGVVSEDSSKFGRLLPLAAMPGTQGIYGFITAILSLAFFGILGGGSSTLTGIQGFEVFLACQPVGWVCLTSGIYQGMTGAAAVGIVAKRDEDAGKALIFPALVETYAVLSLIITILMMLSLRTMFGL